MLPGPLDTTIAHKVINLMPELSGTEKRIAAAIIDHFNRKTGQCDPGFKRIAWLLGISRRTVIRAISQIERTGILLKVRHGGHLQRNSYTPVWARFREFEAAWNARFNTNRARRSHAKMSPGQCQVSPLPGDETVTQTLLTNHMNETCPSGSASAKLRPPSTLVGCKGQAKKEGSKTAQDYFAPSGPGGQSPIEAALSAAERRWSSALHDQYSVTPAVYGEIIGAIDPVMQAAATEAEMRRPGAGILYILNQLQARKTQPSVPGGDVADVTGLQRLRVHKENS
jgi:hypothetical protein